VCVTQKERERERERERECVCFYGGGCVSGGGLCAVNAL